IGCAPRIEVSRWRSASRASTYKLRKAPIGAFASGKLRLDRGERRMVRSRFVRVAVVSAAMTLAIGTQVAHAISVGQGAPEFDLPGADASVRLRDLRGKVVYVDFWASWCGPCKQSFPWLNEMQARYRAQGLEVVGINVDTRRPDADK